MELSLGQKVHQVQRAVSNLRTLSSFPSRLSSNWLPARTRAFVGLGERQAREIRPTERAHIRADGAMTSVVSIHDTVSTAVP